MAEVTSGSFNTSAYVTSSGTKRYLTFSWERTSYSIENNTSTISYTLKGAGNYSGWVNVRNIKLVINGTTVYTAAGPTQVYNTTTLKSGTVTISHNTNGTKSFSASVECGIYYSAINGKGSGTWDLKTIPRASTVKATNADIGSNSTITITRAASTFTHTLTWKCLGLSGTIATKTSGTSISFPIPTSIYEKIPNSPSAKVTITCETFNGSTSLGTSSCEFTATANKETCKPDISVESIVDATSMATSVTGDPTKFVKGISQPKITGLAVTTKNSATLKSFIVDYGVKTGNLVKDGVVNSTIYPVLQVTSNKITLTATDSRDYTYTKEIPITLYDYFKPSMTVNVQRLTQTSNTIKVEYSGKFFNSGIFKKLSLYFNYTKADGTSSTGNKIAEIDEKGNKTVTRGSFTVNGNDFSGSATFDDIAFDYRKEHTVEFVVQDCIQGVTYKQTLFRGVPIFDWSEEDFNFNVPVTFQAAVNFNQPATVDDEPTADFIIEKGTKSVTDSNTNAAVTWNYRKWANGTMECWARRNVNCSVTSKWGTALYYGTVSILPFPFEFKEIPIVHVDVEYGTDAKSLFTASCGASTTVHAKPTMLCRTDSGTFNCDLHYQVIGRWK